MQTLDIRALMDKLDDWTRDAFEAACRLCVARDHLEVEVEHYLLSLLEQPSSGAESLLQHLGVDCLHLIEQLGMTLSRLTPARKATPGVSPRLRVLLRDSWTLASLNFGADRIATGHVLLALAWSDDLQWSTPDELVGLDGSRLAKELETAAAKHGRAVRALMPSARVKSKGAVNVFLCYRREDSEAYAGRLYDCIEREFGAKSVFLDTDHIDPGEVFETVIENRVAACDVLVVLIGKRWLKTANAQGKRRLDEASDWVRREVAVGLNRNKRVVPCLVGGARMPRAAELPSEIVGLAARQAVEISQKTFKRDTETLLDILRRLGSSR